jgi:hypothetical protein
MKRLSLSLLAAVTGCGSVSVQKTDAGASDSGAGTDTAMADVPGTDAPQPRCNPSSPFGTPVAITSLSSTTRDDGLSLSPDGLTAYISSYRDGSGVDHIYTATRGGPNQAFGAPTVLSSVAMGGAFDFAPRISTDGLRLYFASNRGATLDIYLATRTSLITAFGTPQALSVVNSTTAVDEDPFLSDDESAIFFASSRTTGTGLDIYSADKGASGMFNAPILRAGLSSTADDFLPVLTADKLTIYFGSTRTDAPAQGGADIWMSQRTAVAAAFGTPTNVAELNTANDDFPLWLSPDGCTLFIGSGPTANTDFFAATRGP